MLPCKPLLLLLLTLSACRTWAQPEAVFTQDVKTAIQLPKESSPNVRRLFSVKGDIISVASNGVFRYRDGKWTGLRQGSAWTTAALDPDENLWLASSRTIECEKSIHRVSPPPIASRDSILCLFWENPQKLWVGTTSGLLSWEGRWEALPSLKGLRINSIAQDAAGTLYIATTQGLWRRQAAQWVNLDETIMAVGNQRRYYSLARDKAGADILIGGPWSVSCLAGNGNHWAMRGADGLPYGPVTVLRPSPNGLWMGTGQGAIKKDTGWHYYHGKRWLPSNEVNDILIIDSTRVWIATPEGIAQIQRYSLTLEQKADSIEKVIALRHNRRGLVNHSKLREPGILSSSYVDNEDNDGLWTACYLAAACFRYGATQDTAAKALAIRTFEALERLETVTGIPGYPARSYAAATDPVTQSRSPHRKQWHSSPDGAWQWLDDTSSDEITGHLFALPLFYELVADTLQKERVRSLIQRIVTHIVDHQYHLIDMDGKPTRWGIWHPDSLNHSPNWMYERGLNSLQLLTFLKTAFHFTGDLRYEAHYQDLVSQHGYAQNALVAKMFGPFETSHSDDILTFFPYYHLLKYTPNDPNHTLYRQSLLRSWRAVRSDRMPVWDVFASVLLQQDCDLGIAREEIQQYPLDLINWRMENSHRWDLPKDPLLSRFKKAQSTQAIPTPESGISRWNTNPKEFDTGDGGATEDSGTYFLFAYWMGRYHGFWK